MTPIVETIFVVTHPFVDFTAGATAVNFFFKNASVDPDPTKVKAGTLSSIILNAARIFTGRISSGDAAAENSVIS